MVGVLLKFGKFGSSIGSTDHDRRITEMMHSFRIRTAMPKNVTRSRDALSGCHVGLGEAFRRFEQTRLPTTER